MRMIEKDLEILKKILMDLNYAPGYIEMLLSHVVREFEKSTIQNITPHFIYSVLIFEEGRQRARQIADYFEEMKNTGSYRTILQKYFDKK